MKIGVETLLEWQELMVITRKLEEKCAQLTREGVIFGSYHTLVGQEAIAAGIVTALERDGDAIATAHRGNGYFLARGSDLKKMFAEILARETGYCGGRGGKAHMVAMERGIIMSNGIVGAPIPLATGFAFSLKQQGNGNVAMAFFGDGAANQGAFHECVNVAALWKLPVIYVCENNQYAISTSFKNSTSAEHIADRAQGYGIPGILVDGNDPIAMHEVAVEAVDRARRGQGPTLIECDTYRLRGHHEGDSQVYRTQEEVEQWKPKDPILRLGRILQEMGVGQEELDQLEARCSAKVEEAAQFAMESSYPAPETLWDNLFAEDGALK